MAACAIVVYIYIYIYIYIIIIIILTHTPIIQVQKKIIKKNIYNYTYIVKTDKD